MSKWFQASLPPFRIPGYVLCNPPHCATISYNKKAKGAMAPSLCKQSGFVAHPWFGVARNILGELATPIIDNNDQTVFFFALLYFCVFVEWILYNFDRFITHVTSWHAWWNFHFITWLLGVWQGPDFIRCQTEAGYFSNFWLSLRWNIQWRAATEAKFTHLWTKCPNLDQNCHNGVCHIFYGKREWSAEFQTAVTWKWSGFTPSWSAVTWK